MKFNIAPPLSSTSAFRLRSKPYIVSFCRLRSSSSIETSSKRFLFDQKLNSRYFRDKECCAPKKYKTIQVKEGDSVCSNKDKIMEEGRPAFDSVPSFNLQRFVSVKKDDSGSLATGNVLLALDRWNPNMNWGTKRQPLVGQPPQLFDTEEQ